MLFALPPATLFVLQVSTIWTSLLLLHGLGHWPEPSVHLGIVRLFLFPIFLIEMVRFISYGMASVHLRFSSLFVLLLVFISTIAVYVRAPVWRHYNFQSFSSNRWSRQPYRELRSFVYNRVSHNSDSHSQKYHFGLSVSILSNKLSFVLTRLSFAYEIIFCYVPRLSILSVIRRSFVPWSYFMYSRQIPRMGYQIRCVFHAVR